MVDRMGTQIINAYTKHQEMARETLSLQLLECQPCLIKKIAIPKSIALFLLAVLLLTKKKWLVYF